MKAKEFGNFLHRVGTLLHGSAADEDSDFVARIGS
jgi:hypothetical protein